MIGDEMGDIWSDLQLALIIIVFIYIVSWASDLTKSKKIGVILALIITYLTVYQHTWLLILVVLIFFGYAFIEKFTAEVAD